MSTGQTPPRIAVFAGPTATITNTPPLVTANAVRRLHGLPLLPGRYDALRPQRLAKPVTVYVEAHSAHPLESDAAELYAPPDGWIDVVLDQPYGPVAHDGVHPARVPAAAAT